MYLRRVLLPVVYLHVLRCFQSAYPKLRQKLGHPVVYSPCMYLPILKRNRYNWKDCSIEQRCCIEDNYPLSPIGQSKGGMVYSWNKTRAMCVFFYEETNSTELS